MNKKEFIFVLIVTAIVTIIWVASDILRASPTYTVDPQVESLEQPFDASFPQDTLQQIKSLNTQMNSSPSADILSPSSPVPSPTMKISTSSANKK